MTKRISLFLGLLFASFANIETVQAIGGTELEIGPAGSNQVTTANSLSGAMGSYNNVAAVHSVAIGWYNQVHAGDGLAAGHGNHLGSQYAGPGGIASFASGAGSFVTGNYCASFGQYSYAVGTSLEVTGALNSLVGGYGCTNFGANSFVVGFQSAISGFSDGEQTTCSAAVGTNLVVNWSTAFVTGFNNDKTIPKDSGLLFAVGNGTESGAIEDASNVFEVYANGRIWFPKQGDIDMGEFGEQP